MESALAHVLEIGEQRTSDVAAGAFQFNELNLKRELLSSLRSHKFCTPTKIQAAAIPMGIAGLDLLVQSKSGTGKTLIYVLTALQLLQKSVRQPQVLIVVPTRELAIQVEDTVNGLASCRRINDNVAYSFIGGTEVKNDRIRMAKGRIIVGTLGRLLHLVQNRVFDTSAIKLLVLDEADQLYATPSLQTGLMELMGGLSPKYQIIACSATYPNGLDERLASLMHKPILVSNSERATVLLGIRQFVYELPEQLNSMQEMLAKLAALKTIFSQLPYNQGVLFASSQSRADSFRNYLRRSGVECELMSGAMKQSDRTETFQGFRSFKVRTIVATDLMARGVDGSHANLVINLDVPKDLVTYLHRIGRAGRFGSKGIAITFVSSPEQCTNFKRIIAEAGTGMSVMQFPTTKREGIDFWDYDAYEFSYFSKAEAHEQEESELKRIKQRWKGADNAGPAQQTEISQNLSDKEDVNDNVPPEEVKEQAELQENSVAQQPKCTEQIKALQGTETPIAKDPYYELNLVNQAASESEPQLLKNIRYEIQLLEELASMVSDEEVEEDAQLVAELEPQLIKEEQLNVEPIHDVHSAKEQQIIIQVEANEKALKLQEPPLEPVELTPSIELPAAAPNSINTKTYCLAAPTERSSTTLQPLAVSNTVDDASSIISDSMENDYDSDASFESYYTLSDARIIWRRGVVQKKLQPRIQRNAAQRIFYYNWRHHNTVGRAFVHLLRANQWWDKYLLKENMKRLIRKLKLAAAKGHQLIGLTKRRVKRLMAKKKEYSCLMRSEEYLSFPERICRQEELVNKFDEKLQIRRRLGRKIKKYHMWPKLFLPVYNRTQDAMEHYYYVPYNKPKQVKDFTVPADTHSDKYNKLNEVDELVEEAGDAAEEQQAEQPLNKLSVHVNQQLDIPPAELDSDDYDENESVGNASVEPYSSSGFVESTESASSGIDTSRTDSLTWPPVDSDDYEETSDDEDEYDLESELDSTESDTISSSVSTITAESNANDSTEDGEESETETEQQQAIDVNSAAAELVLAQARWQHLFQMQYQFIANYVDNFMAAQRQPQ